MVDFREKRQQFRVDMINNIPATAKIYSINAHKIEEERKIPIKILDLSSGGMRAFMSVDIPINIIVISTIFEFENEYFHFNAQIIRKTFKDDGYEYGLRFIFNNNCDESRIIRNLNQYKIKYTRFKKIELDLRNQKYLGSFVKVLELIEVPAYLITKHRIVVSMNRMAREMGVRLGERCYRTVGKLHRICPHCQLEEALKVDHPVENVATFLDEECTARWLYLEDDYTIHYYIGRSI